MKIFEFVNEGGWSNEVTQSTVIRPPLVAQALKQVEKFVKDFNRWLPANMPKIEMGYPTGSSAYHEVESAEDPEKIYGDIDLQMIAAPLKPDASLSAYSAEWNKLVDKFLQEQKPDYVYDSAEPVNGHPIFNVGGDQYVQVDFMWHTPKLKDWGRYRATPERGLKGTLSGNLFSVLGDLIGMSIQYGGAQIKLQDGKPVSFSKQKGVELHTVSNNIERFVLDILIWLYKLQGKSGKPQVAKLLKDNPGLDTKEVKVQNLINAIRGLAESFALNDMYGVAPLNDFANPDQFINKFLEVYSGKAMDTVANKKFDKAATADAIARAADTKQKLITGLARVQAMFKS
jgi:hypothetical protein